MADWTPPTRDGETSGTDRASGLAWAVEAPQAHWDAHDGRQVAYWRSRTPDERLAQARWYRERVDSNATPPTTWQWTLIPAHDDC